MATQLTAATLRLDVKPEHRTALRDYFLRLGCDARVDDGGAVEVSNPSGAETDETVMRFLDRWVEANGVEVSPAPDAVDAATPVAPRPLTLLTGGGGRPPLRVGDLLASKGLISQAQLAEALQESRATGERVGAVLLRRRWVFEDELARTLAQQWSLPYLNLLAVGVDWGAVRLLPASVGLEAAAIPVRFVGSSVQVAFADPSDDAAVEAVAEHVESPQLAVAELTHIQLLWRRAASGR